MMQEVLHARKYAAIVTCCCHDHSVITECVLYYFCHIFSRKITDNDFFCTLAAEDFCKFLCCFTGIAMNRRICDQDTFAFRLITCLLYTSDAADEL